MLDWLIERSPTIIVSFGALISALSAFWIALYHPSLSRRALRISAFVIFFGSFLSVLGELLSSHEQLEYEHELRKKSDQIAELNKEIAELNKTTLASVTGGDSFGYLELIFTDDTKGVGTLWFFRKGNYPLYDVGITIQDMEKIRSLIESLKVKKGDSGKFITIDPWEPEYEEMENMWLQGVARIQLGNIGAVLGSRLGKWRLPDQVERQRYKVQVVARNGIFIQDLRFQRFNGRWKTATRVVKNIAIYLGSTEKDIEPYKSAAPEFGDVDWSKY